MCYCFEFIVSQGCFKCQLRNFVIFGDFSKQFFQKLIKTKQELFWSVTLQTFHQNIYYSENTSSSQPKYENIFALIFQLSVSSIFQNSKMFTRWYANHHLWDCFRNFSTKQINFNFVSLLLLPGKIISNKHKASYFEVIGLRFASKWEYSSRKPQSLIFVN